MRLLESAFQLLLLQKGKKQSGQSATDATSLGKDDEKKKKTTGTLSCDEVNVVRMRRCLRFSASDDSDGTATPPTDRPWTEGWTPGRQNGADEEQDAGSTP